MENLMNQEEQIRTDIEALRARCNDTQELYREVCALLFFRYGITPTGNKLYSLVRKGTMSAPSQALAKFWDDLREKSRVRIEHPDLPDSLKTAAAALVMSLWDQAQEAAKETFATVTEEVKGQIERSTREVVAAHIERDAARDLADSRAQEAAIAHGRIGQLEQALAAESAKVQVLNDQLTALQGEKIELSWSLETARRDFAHELEQQRAAVSLAEMRYKALEVRALQDIEAERQVSAKLQRELDAVRNQASEAAEKQRKVVEDLHAQIGNLQQRLGLERGKAESMSHERDVLNEKLLAAQASNSTLMVVLGRAQSEADNWKRTAESAQSQIKEMSKKQRRKSE